MIQWYRKQRGTREIRLEPHLGLGRELSDETNLFKVRTRICLFPLQGEWVKALNEDCSMKDGDASRGLTSCYLHNCMKRILLVFSTATEILTWRNVVAPFPCIPFLCDVYGCKCCHRLSLISQVAGFRQRTEAKSKPSKHQQVFLQSFLNLRLWASTFYYRIQIEFKGFCLQQLVILCLQLRYLN